MRLPLALAALLFAAPALAEGAAEGEKIVAGMSESQIAITASFTGTDILVFGAVKREAPIPTGKPLQVIVTLQGPELPVEVTRKGHVLGLWVNTGRRRLAEVPSYYAVATSGQLSEVLTPADDQRYRISLPEAIHPLGSAGPAAGTPAFVQALMRIRQAQGLYALDEGSVTIEQSTLFRADLALPADLTEGTYRLRIYLTRDGQVVDSHASDVLVRKIGLERWLYRLSLEKPAIYGLLSLVIAILAGWLASAAFRLLKR